MGKQSERFAHVYAEASAAQCRHAMTARTGTAFAHARKLHSHWIQMYQGV